jgi:DNA-binding MarR family transcriptional regulator
MNEIKTTITEQLQQLQMLMHRASFQGIMGGGRMHNPHRGQGRVLAILKLKPEISQKELTYLLNMSKQALAELLAKLEKSGFITREPSEEDKRVMTIKLTEAGVNAAEDVDDGAPETAKILDCLNEEELAAFSDSLDKIIKRYEELFPGEDFEERRKMMEAFMCRHGHGFGGHQGRPGGFGECHGPRGGGDDRRGGHDWHGGFGGDGDDRRGGGDDRRGGGDDRRGGGDDRRGGGFGGDRDGHGGDHERHSGFGGDRDARRGGGFGGGGFGGGRHGGRE